MNSTLKSSWSNSSPATMAPISVQG
jgi:hypothetical protein